VPAQEPMKRRSPATVGVEKTQPPVSYCQSSFGLPDESDGVAPFFRGCAQLEDANKMKVEIRLKHLFIRASPKD